MNSFKTAEAIAEPPDTILAEGAVSPHLYTILSGWVFRYKTLPDGGRQILNFGLPGDFLGLQSAMMEAMGHSVEALTRVTLCVFPREKLWTLYQSHPSLAFDVTWLASREERVMDEHLLAVGRRSASERVAFMLLALWQRARLVNLVEDNVLRFPLTQQHLADALGLSVVHTNKVIRKLTERDLILWRGGALSVRDEAGLRSLASYDSAEKSCRPFI
ncbi:MAG: Crp/Fnr family transcriptional regulator [Hyphomicrobiales bacterium]|nr:Crp/Fnr family transcriptional regulator [Hyphomicrobiales bacterium]